MTAEVISDLMRFAGFRLYSAPASFRQSANADPADLGRSLDVAYVVKGSVRSAGGLVRVSAALVEANAGRVMWSETYDRPLTPDNLLDVQDDVVGEVASRLAEPYGVINDAIAAALRTQSPRTMFAYGCVLRAYTYRVTFSPELYPSTRAGLLDANTLGVVPTLGVTFTCDYEPVKAVADALDRGSGDSVQSRPRRREQKSGKIAGRGFQAVHRPL